MAPKLPPIGSVNTCVAQRDAPGLAKLLNEQQPNSSDLFTLLKVSVQRTLLAANDNPAEIDSIVDFYAQTASKLDKSLTHKGNEQVLPPRSSQPRPKNLPVRECSGRDLLAEHLGVQLFHELWNPTCRMYTPHPELDENKGRDYYRSAFVYSALLARAFSLQPSFRQRLWRTVEEVLIKGIFSGTMQEPGNFLVTSVVLYGAGSGVKAQNRGKGKDWYQYTDTLNEPDATWGWFDIVSTLMDVESLIEPGFDRPLPEKVLTAFKGLREYIGDGRAELKDMSSKELWAKFNWVEGMVDPPPAPERPNPNPEDVLEGDIPVLHPGDPGYEEE